ncbi:MAG: hypothetical protein ACI4QJ_04020 [Candidatus Spyradenecus sp.]
MKLQSIRFGMGVVFGAALVGSAAWGGSVQVGSAASPVSSGAWSTLGAAVQSGDDVELYAANGATITFDVPLSVASLQVTCAGTATLQVNEGVDFATGQTVLTPGTRVTVGGAGGNLGALSAQGTGNNENGLTLTSGQWQFSGLSVAYWAGEDNLIWQVQPGAKAVVEGELCCNCLSLTVGGRMTVRGGVKSASANYRAGWVTVASGGTLTVEGDYTVANVWAAHQLTVASGGCLEINGQLLFNSGKTDSGNKLQVNGTLRANAVSVPMRSGVEVVLEGGCVVLKGGNWLCTPAQTWTRFSFLALEDATLSGGAVTLVGDSALCPWPDKVLTLSPSALAGSGAVTLRGNLGTVDVGTLRPTLSGQLAGTLRFTPAAGERAIAFPCTPLVPASNYFKLVCTASGWEEARQTLITGQNGWLGYALESVPTLSVAGAAQWSTGAWAYIEAGVPTSGTVTVVGSGTLTVDCAVSLTSLQLNAGTAALSVEGERLASAETVVGSGEVVARSGSYGALTVAEDAAFLLANGSSATVESIPAGARVGVYGAGAMSSAQAAIWLLRNGTFRKSGEGTFTVSTYNQSDVAGKSVEVTGGTLELKETGGSGNYTWQDLTVAKDCTLAFPATWGTRVTVAGNLRGEGAVQIPAHSSGGAQRTVYWTGETAEFVGQLAVTGVALELAGGRTGRFGGSLSVKETSSRQGSLKVTNATGLTILKSLTLGSGTELNLEAGGLTVLGGLTVEGPVTVTMPSGAQAGDTVIDLGEGAADAATAANLSVDGFTVVADGSQYVLQ